MENNENIETFDIAAQLKKASQASPTDLLDAQFEKMDSEKEDTSIEENLNSEENQTDDIEDVEFEPIKETEINKEGAISQITKSPEKLADALIEFGGALMESLGPSAYRMTFSKEDSNSLKDLARKYRKSKRDKSPMELTEKDQDIMKVYLEYEDYCEELELDDDEKKSIREPLIEVLKETNYQSSPKNALLVACAMVALPRTLPILKNKFL